MLMPPASNPASTSKGQESINDFEVLSLGENDLDFFATQVKNNLLGLTATVEHQQAANLE